MVLHHDVPKMAPAVVGPCVQRLLARHGLWLSDIRWVSCHPGGRAVLDNLRDSLGFTEEQLRYSRQVLRNYGNMSSGTIGAVAHVLADERAQVRPGDWVLMVTMGAGFASNAALLRFPT
ncbi:MAG: 3-oxoacyl-[acyl-carrier-protein] synthase III C-terminal domain-containing protein [Chloroflexota bacterium]|nr:3-oxoacyl-[acyl-carrier-protein] synthase III C-terminal domain-containing protein [Chloroflexota bacterium]